MKIALVCPDFYPHIGGVETVVFQLAQNLAARGFEITVLTQSNNNELPKEEILHNFKILRFKTSGFGELKISLGLLNYLSKSSNKFDVTHIHNYHSFPALAAILTKKTPVIFSPHYHGTGHSLLTHLIHYPYTLIGKFIFSKSDVIFSDTEAEAQLIKKHFPEVKNVTVVPLGIDVSGIEKAKKLTQKSKYILSVGRLESYKNAEVIIKSLEFIDKEISLILVGSGPLLNELKEKTQKLNLKNRVTFLSNVSGEKLFSLFKNAEAFVSMSTMEAYGLSLLEAAAAKIGIVASDIPSHRELITGFKISNAFLISPNSSARDLADSIKKAILKPSQAEEKLPSWGAVTKETLKIYKKYA